ncbi:MAG TPA: hypothetical protein VK034_30680, partial [Enhygromyxa sp.]|nr:hypothetical protein [Enhygromyxa sp.]
FDNTARNVTVSNFCIGPGVSHGFRSEWDHNTTCRGGVHVFTKQQADDCLATNDPGGEFFTRGVNHVVEYGLVEASDIGVLFHRGTVNGDVNNVTFRNYSFAAIAFHDNVSTETLWPLYDDGSSQSDNTFEECGVCELTFDWNGTPCCEDIPSSCDPVSCL